MPKKAKSTTPIEFVRQVQDELTLVTWPTREATIQMTVIVIITTVAVGAYLGGLDYLLTLVMDQII